MPEYVVPLVLFVLVSIPAVPQVISFAQQILQASMNAPLNGNRLVISSSQTIASDNNTTTTTSTTNTSSNNSDSSQSLLKGALPPSMQQVAILVETAGVSGATQTLLAQLTQQIQALLKSDQITIAEAGQLNDLANQGYRMGSIQSSVESYIKANGYDYKQAVVDNITINGETDTVYAWITRVGTSGGVGDNANSSNFTDILSQNVGHIENQKFINLYNKAKSDGILNNPTVYNLVTGLSAQIAYIGGQFEQSLPQDNISPVNLDAFKKQVASNITNSGATGICTAGNGSSTGATCQ